MCFWVAARSPPIRRFHAIAIHAVRRLIFVALTITTKHHSDATTHVTSPGAQQQKPGIVPGGGPGGAAASSAAAGTRRAPRRIGRRGQGGEVEGAVPRAEASAF